MITVNGQKTAFQQNESLSDLLKRFEVKPVGIAVEVNERLVPMVEHDSTTIVENDRIEIVSLVGGG